MTHCGWQKIYFIFHQSCPWLLPQFIFPVNNVGVPAFFLKWTQSILSHSRISFPRLCSYINLLLLIVCFCPSPPQFLPAFLIFRIPPTKTRLHLSLSGPLLVHYPQPFTCYTPLFNGLCFLAPPCSNLIAAQPPGSPDDHSDRANR